MRISFPVSNRVQKLYDYVGQFVGPKYTYNNGERITMMFLDDELGARAFVKAVVLGLQPSIDEDDEDWRTAVENDPMNQ